MLSSVVPSYHRNNAIASEDPPQNLTSKFLSTLLTFEAMMYGCQPGSTDCPSPFAVRASIYPCAKLYGGNITMSTLKETTISSIPLTQNFRGDFTLVTTTTIRNDSISECKVENGSPASVNSAAVYGDYNNIPDSVFLTTALPNNTVERYAPDCVYSMKYWPVLSVLEVLDVFFNQNNLPSPQGSYSAVAGDLWLTNLYQDGTANMSTVNNYMQWLAHSMTAVIRTRGDAASPGYNNYASGTMYDNQTCIHVRWGWLALPAALLLVGIGFLVATIISTSTQRRGTSKFGPGDLGHFKSSPLALLFHGIEPTTLQTLQQPQDVAGMEALAERSQVSRFRDSASGTTYLISEEEIAGNR